MHGRRENEGRKVKTINHYKHIKVLFLTYLVLLERFRRNDFNYTLKNHQIRP